MARGSTFPAFIQAKYQPSSDGFPAFQKAAEESTRRAERSIDDLFNKLSRGFGDFGHFTVNTGELQKATQAAQQHAAATRLVAEAAERAAAAESGNSAALNRAAQQARAAAIEAENYAAAMRGQEQVARAVSQQLGATSRVMTSYGDRSRSLTTSLGQQNQAALSLGQQINDLAVQLASGQNPAVAFAQQLSQATYALNGFGGTMGKVGRFLGGPWGVALTVGATAAAALGGKLLETSENADTAARSFDSFGEAQGLLGKIVDLTTGKLTQQNAVLREAIELEARRNIIAAQKAERQSVEKLRDFGSSTFGEAVSLGFAGGSGEHLFDPRHQLAENRRQIASRAPLNEAIAKFADGGFATKADPTGVESAIAQVERLGTASQLAGRDLLALKEAIIAVGKDRNDLAANQAIVDFLNGGSLDPRLRPYKRDQKPKSTAGRDEFGRDAADRIANLAAPFRDEPDQVEKVRRALLQLDDLVDDISRKKPLNMQQLLQDAGAARVAITEGIGKPFADYVRAEKEAHAVQLLMAQGRTVEADALRAALQLQGKKGELAETELATITAMAIKREQEIRAAEHVRAIVESYVAVVGDAQQAFERLVGRVSSAKNPLKAVGGFATDLVNSYVQTTIRNFAIRLFSGVEQQVRDFATPQQALDNATTKAAGAVEAFASVLVLTTNAIRGTAGTSGSIAAPLSTAFGLTGRDLPLSTTADDIDLALKDVSLDIDDKLREIGFGGANDNDAGGDIVVEGQRKQLDETRRQTDAIVKSTVTTSGVMTKAIDEIAGNLTGLAKGTPFEGIATALEKLVKGRGGDLLSGGLIGGAVGGLVFGGNKGAQIGASIGGSFGKVAGKELGKTVLKSLGNFAGPVGGVLGGLAGGLIGGLFTRTKTGSASLGYDSKTGSFTSSLSGNSQSYQQVADNLGNSVTGSLQKIADVLGGELGDFAVSIGVRKKKYVVDPTGEGRTKGTGLKFKDEADAIQAAIADAIRDGAIQGIRAGTQRLLQQGTDLDTQIGRAAKFEGVFKSLRQAMDPVGYAVDELNRQFEDLKRVFAAAGATSEEYAQLEQLYQLQRTQAIKQAASAMRSTLQSLLDDLTIGEAGGRSLKDRLDAALAQYNPLADQIRGGATNVDYDAFTDIARTVQDLARQLYGSQEGFFSIVGDMETLTRKALEQQQAMIDIATGATTPFDASAPTTSTPSNDNAPVVAGLSAVEEAIQQGLIAVNGSVQQVLAAIRTGQPLVLSAPDARGLARMNF